mgnify:CR=1 FL=1|tara:strand:+ start:63 stop:449 length:387 start_codon:yes stop_codon:yes gene_type:complete
MKITKSKLKQLIKEEISKVVREGKLIVTRSGYGGMFVEDEEGNDITVGDMVLDLIGGSVTDFFVPNGSANDAALETLIAAHKKGVQGGMQRWDSDVFSDYYNVDTNAVLQKYAKLKGHEISEEAGESY